ncbi:MAG: hypothetical protein J6M60_03520 [Clostridia bacterium]|nr:hypothetical protein [Clostridia bacterium]
MYDSIRNLCNNQINFANTQLKYKKDDYYKGVIDANIKILKQLNKNEEFINKHPKIYIPRNLLKQRKII